MSRFRTWLNHPEDFTPAEIRKWQERLDHMPDLVDAFRLIREIIAGNASQLGTMLTQQSITSNRLDRAEAAIRALIEQVTTNNNEILALGDKIERLSDQLTILALEKEDSTDGQT